jgi:hypothetical protein
MSELNDNNDLAQRAGFLLTRTCGVIPPRELISPFLHAIFQVIEETSVRREYMWRRQGHLYANFSHGGFASKLYPCFKVCTLSSCYNYEVEIYFFQSFISVRCSFSAMSELCSFWRFVHIPDIKWYTHRYIGGLQMFGWWKYFCTRDCSYVCSFVDYKILS